MKKNFFKRITALVIASLMPFGVITFLPEKYLPSLYININAVNSYSDFSDVPCGEYSTMSLSGNWLTISGAGNMYEIALDNQLSGYSTYYDYRQNAANYVKEVTINSGITSIGSFAFSGFSNLSSIVIPDTVECINSYAFLGCTSLGSISIPKNTELSIYNDTIFSGANKNLIIYGYKGSSAEEYAIEYGIKFATLNDNDNIIKSGKCGDNAYYVIQNNGTMIINGYGDMYGYMYSSHESIMKDSGIPWYNSRSYIKKLVINNGITGIGNTAFYGCSALTSVEIPETVTSIGNHSFMACGLDNILIPQSVTNIGSYAFYGCNLTKLSVGKAEVLSEGSFGGNNFVKVIIPKGVKHIGREAFTYCSLNYVEIPEGVETIGYEAFAHSYNLNKVYIPKSVIDIDKTAFRTTYSNPDNLIIYGYKNSIAESFANENNIPFIALDENIEFTSATMTQFTNPVNIDDELLFNVIIRDCEGNPVNVSDLSFEPCFTTTVSDNSCIKIDSEAIDLTGAFIKATAIGNGTATITVTFSNGVSVTSTVTVGKSETEDNNTDTASDPRYEKLYLQFEPKNISYTYNVDTESFDVDSTDCEINLSCLDLLQTGLFMDVNKIVVTPPKGFSVNGLEERVPLEYSYIIPEPINGGSDGDLSEHFVLYPPTKEFLNGNPLTDSYTTELTITVYGDDDFVKTFKQTITINYTDVTEKIYFINEHYLSAHSGAWKNLTQTSDIKKQLENSSSEWAQVASQYEQYGVKLFSLNPIGIYNQYSLNEYDAILLDMFYSTEGLDKADSIFDMSMLKSEETAIKTIQKFMKAEKIVEFSSDAEYYEFSKKLYQLAYSLGSVSDSDLEKLLSDSGYSYNNIKVMNHNIALAGTMDAWDTLSNGLNKIGITVTTFKDFLDNMNTIVNAQALYNMKEEYKAILDEINIESQKYVGNSWEIKDLQNAIRNQMDYYENDFFNDAWECFKIAYEASDGIVKIFTNKSIAENVTGVSIKTILSNAIAGYLGDDVIARLAASSGITGVTTAEAKKGITLGAKVVGKYLGAVGLGVSIGDTLNQLLFSQNTKTQLYYKAKCYAVLEDILYVVLNNKSNELLKLISTNSTIDEQHIAAIKYDKAFKMYMFTEANGLITYGEYEKTFVTEEIVDGDTIIDKILKKFKEIGNVITEGTEFYVKSIQFGSFDKSAQKILEERMSHLTNATLFQADGNYILENCKCHDDYSIGSSKYKDIFGMYKAIKATNCKVAIINCPVEVSVFDDLGNLIGTLSSKGSNVTSGYEIYLYRIESTDSNIVILPDDYTIKINGIEKGTMDIITMYYNGNEVINGMLYYDVPVDANYEAELIISSDKIDLNEDNHEHSYSPNITPTTNVTSTNSTTSMTFNVKVENKITGKTNKAKATQTGENVTVDVGKKNNGYYANIYTTDGSLLNSVKIKSGKAKFTIQNDIDFYIIIDETSHLEYEDVSSGAGIYELFEDKKEPLCIFIIIVAVLGFSSIIIVKRSVKNKR